MEVNRQENEFVCPPEAPVYRPTVEEFKDPITYIESIRLEAEKYGICKIIPPPNWNPPFTPHPDEFQFHPRIQRLNHLDAKTRLKVKWMKKLKLFWSMSGPLKVPVVHGRPIDVFTLNELVGEEVDGTKIEDKPASYWNSLAYKMGLKFDNKEDASSLQAVYCEIIQPMNRFMSSLPDQESVSFSNKDNYKKETSPLSKKPKLNRKRKSAAKMLFGNPVGVISGKCPSCSKVEQDQCVKCNYCKQKYHVPCLDTQPEEYAGQHWEWNCKNCVASKMSNVNTLRFGFSESPTMYSLASFGEQADSFKSSFFEVKDPADVPTEEVERMFWRLVGCPYSDFKVMYGADLSVRSHGSGFPTATGHNNDPGLEEYVKSGWNLNNLPGSPNSLLKFIKGDVSGMKVPWMYAGMCFSSFCWHNEDHWTYSINYLHWGEPKTWYGVPGVDADLFEARVKEIVPQLFKYQPDLLHQLVTLINPSLLLSGNVKVHRLDQKAGEFVITFPRAYHAGFNQGFNFAEAVNFATTSWLPNGFKSIMNYAEQGRNCVFSHEEMLCEMVRQVSSLELNLAVEAHKELSFILNQERDFRRLLDTFGVKIQQRVHFEDFANDDDRSCAFCHTTIFLSSLACSCLKAKGKRVCNRHYKMLCSCPSSKLHLHYRYTLEELEEMVKILFNHIHISTTN